MSETQTIRRQDTGATRAAPVVLQDDNPAGVARTRAAARAFAERLEPALASDAADTLALVVSELATNALRHGGGRYTLQLHATADAVHVAVSDRTPAPPREHAPDLNRGTGGFGWTMVRHLTSGVTITPDPQPGKTIHVRLPR